MAEIVKKTTLEKGTPSGGSGKGIIESEVFDASRKARGIMLDAQGRADQILREAEDQAAALYAEARRKGYEEGRQEGVAEFSQGIVENNQRVDVLLEQAEEQLLRLASGIAEKILGQELEQNHDAMVAIVRRAIAPMNRKKAITIRIHPKDREILELHRQDLLETMVNGGHVNFQTDPAIRQGGCLVETEHGSVDARLETQLATFHRLLTGEEFRPVSRTVEPEPRLVAPEAITPVVRTRPAQRLEIPQESFHPVIEDNLIREPVSQIETAEFEESVAEQVEPQVAIPKSDDGGELAFRKALAHAGLLIDDEEEQTADFVESERRATVTEEQVESEAEEVPARLSPQVMSEIDEIASQLDSGMDVDDLLANLDSVLGEDEGKEP